MALGRIPGAPGSGGSEIVTVMSSGAWSGRPGPAAPPPDAPPRVVVVGAGIAGLAAPVRGLRRRPDGSELLVGSTRDAQLLRAHAVVPAVPAHPASRLLAEAVPSAATELAGIDYASMAIVAAAWPREAVRRLPAGSGFLIPAVDGGLVKAVTLSTSKWGFLAGEVPGTVLARMSIGRMGEEADLQREDDELGAAAVAELAPVLGLSGLPVATRETRWGRGLPQYAVGHLDRVERIRSALAAMPGLAVCGAAYDGIGVPACIASARRAAETVPTHVGATPEAG